jgi:hypothetical protein
MVEQTNSESKKSFFMRGVLRQKFCNVDYQGELEPELPEIMSVGQGAVKPKPARVAVFALGMVPFSVPAIQKPK